MGRGRRLLRAHVGPLLREDVPVAHAIEVTDARRIREAFRASAQWFASVVDDIGGDRWTDTALGMWTVRGLVGHCSVNCTMILELLDPSGAPRRLVGPLEFWRGVLAGSRTETHAAIARDAESAADRLGVDPQIALRGLVTRTIELVDGSSDGAPLRFGEAGELALIDFLPSRIVEFVAHGLDVCRATGRDHADVPADAARLAAGWLSEFGDPIVVVQRLLGRDHPPNSVFD
jgi:uncharacterized protein (TIGR03083 family)